MSEQDKRDTVAQQLIQTQFIRNALSEVGLNRVTAPKIMGALDDLESGLKLGGIGIWK